MLQRYLILVAAWLELVTGIVLVISPAFTCLLLFATPLDDAGVAIARFSGVVLLALGTVCVATPSKPYPRGAALGLLVYNVGVVVLFVWLGVTTTLHGLLLWPATILHACVAAALLRQTLHEQVKIALQ
jgi:hypothetical protein